MPEPRPTSEPVARALTKSSSERLALGGTAVASSSDASLRILADRRRHLERARARTEERLAETESRLEELGWRGRRRQGPGLRAEIGFQRAALAAAARQLTELPPIALPATPQRADRALGRTPSRDRALMSRRAPAREPCGLDLDL